VSAMYPPLVLIDIPKARASILKSISEYRRMHRLSELMQQFFEALSAAKKIDARSAGKLQTLLQEQAPELKAYRFIYSKAEPVLSGHYEYTYRVFMYDMDDRGEQSFRVRANEDGTLNIDDALIAHRKWKAHADFLEEKLPRFAYNAQKYNDMLTALKNMMEYAVPAGEHYPVYPLSDFFGWYQLSR